MKQVQKLTIKTPDRRQWRSFGVFIVNFEHIWYLVVVFLLLDLNMLLPAWKGLILKKIVNSYEEVFFEEMLKDITPAQSQ